MTTHAPSRRASLEVLRAEAADERETLIRERVAWGEDPWDFMDDLPTVDELVVLLIRADHILLDGGVRPTKQRHDAVLRGIASDHPSLAAACERLMASSNTSRRWDAVVRPPGVEAQATHAPIEVASIGDGVTAQTEEQP